MITTPKNVVVILLDSLNKHDLPSFGGVQYDTPNIDRLAARSIRFTNHHTGSLPCIPARHDILVGAWDFLWKPWGSIELWEEAITASLRRKGVITQLITDHPHLFEVGGENFHSDFTAWDYARGHESDAWKTRPDDSWIGAPSFGRGHTHYDNSRGYFADADDFPGPRTMRAAAEWIRTSSTYHRARGERFLLFVDEFDPHEPFDTPEAWAAMYDDSWEGPHLVWPPYAVDAIAKGILSQREAHQIHSQYGSKISMIDHYLGKVIDALDTTGAWEDTAIFLCTDHGHYLGDFDVHGRDIWGKPAIPVYKELGHIPMLVCWPGVTPGVCDALTTSTDIHATITEIFEAQVSHRTHGQSLTPLLADPRQSIREWVLTGVWGREVQLVTNEWRYVRGPIGANAPLSMWSNRWSTMPLAKYPNFKIPPPDQRAVLDHMPGTTIPVIRQQFVEGDLLPFWAMGTGCEHILFHRGEDPAEKINIVTGSEGKDATELLRHALQHVEAPADHFVRLGLS